jgi:DNA-binding CsgD family transcriptional regulator
MLPVEFGSRYRCCLNLMTLLAFSSLSFQEQELVIAFFLRRGNMTNKELGAILDSSENQIKGRMYSIFHKLDGVTTRTALLSYIEDNI